MNKLHIISNRLPFQVNKLENTYSLVESVGGLATGMKSVYKKLGGYWIGWSGIAHETISADESNTIDDLLKKEFCLSVPLSSDEINLYYEGFSNNTIWPLFHYFTQHATYKHDDWDAYVRVNQKFADYALSVCNDDDTIWIHDYQLLLVPGMIKKANPNISIGYFLHIPFPSYEVFRLLPWRKELLEGILGADLIGFHTYDYERHFFSCVRRLLGFDVNMNQINIGSRIVVADAFPMGIDYNKFEAKAQEIIAKPDLEKTDFSKELERFIEQFPERKLILSIDRLDYSKGIPNRLKSFERFLAKYPEVVGKVTFVMLAVPSREQIEHYQQLKREVDELVGSINAKYREINYSPIWYFYRSMPFDQLVELYVKSEIALITPVRDGMNLVAKEYVASKINKKGVIIISEMAGASKEMCEALIINPNNEEEIADTLFQAMNMTDEEQIQRMSQLQLRLKRYDLFKWASEFIKGLDKVAGIQRVFNTKSISQNIFSAIKTHYAQANKRVLFLDYDGTLVGFKSNPVLTKPDESLLNILRTLAADKRNEIVIISGRDKNTLNLWFNENNIHLIAEHGIWHRRIDSDWTMSVALDNAWMLKIKPLLEHFVDITPATFIEEKSYSLVWHYRNAEQEYSERRAIELKDELKHLIGNQNIEIMDGDKVIEIKVGGVNKGIAAAAFLSEFPAEFILAIGDDWTDEFMFKELPDTTHSIKVGIKQTFAKYKLDSVEKVREFLSALH
ncbi:MAG: bifunctional alpha,alpha-trehalose-phosphate synthase (UDP-forming)/trehalose-phosphatase [Bacteroidales bacterium]|nr:bifunctional alpha,alpha-trehalose-phosphate synthase (UDP-forming)/trehalose-phosphatase [Bacteroidales bacterium]